MILFLMCSLKNGVGKGIIFKPFDLPCHYPLEEKQN